MKIDYYLHNHYRGSEIVEYLTDEVGIDNFELIEKLTESIQNFFYEVGFYVEFNEKGEITKVEMKKKV